MAITIRNAIRDKDPAAALAAYDAAIAEGIKVQSDSFNILLFLCAGGDNWAAPSLSVQQEEGGTVSPASDFHALYSRGQSIFKAMAEQGMEEDCLGHLCIRMPT